MTETIKNTENDIKLRPLATRDLALFSKIVKKMEVRKDIVNLFRVVSVEREEGMTDEDYQIKVNEAEQTQNNKLMAELLIILVENYHKAQNEVYELLSRLADISVEEVAELKLGDFIKLLKGLAEDESITDFFNLVA